jgi:hypothetical protein
MFGGISSPGLYAHGSTTKNILMEQYRHFAVSYVNDKPITYKYQSSHSDIIFIIRTAVVRCTGSSSGGYGWLGVGDNGVDSVRWWRYDKPGAWRFGLSAGTAEVHRKAF